MSPKCLSIGEGDSLNLMVYLFMPVTITYQIKISIPWHGN